MRKTKKSHSKVKLLEKKLKDEVQKSKEHLDRLMYLQADFENYRKRIEKTINEVTQLEKEKLIFNLLDVVDELELAISSGRKTENHTALLEGVEMTLNKLYSTLKQEGLQIIQTAGKPFDPKLHEVVMKVTTKEYEEGEIIEDVRKGFIFRDKVMRPSMVKIATHTGDNSESKE